MLTRHEMHIENNFHTRTVQKYTHSLSVTVYQIG